MCFHITVQPSAVAATLEWICWPPSGKCLICLGLPERRSFLRKLNLRHHCFLLLLYFTSTVSPPCANTLDATLVQKEAIKHLVEVGLVRGFRRGGFSPAHMHNLTNVFETWRKFITARIPFFGHVWAATCRTVFHVHLGPPGLLGSVTPVNGNCLA